MVLNALSEIGMADEVGNRLHVWLNIGSSAIAANTIERKGLLSGVRVYWLPTIWQGITYRITRVGSSGSIADIRASVSLRDTPAAF